MAYQPMQSGPFQIIIDRDTKPYSLEGVPDGATEILIYAFISVRNKQLKEAQRAYYEFVTCDKYKQCMNVVYPG